MCTPRSPLRSTAYHRVEASPLPWILSHGRGGSSPSGTMPARASWS